MLSAINFGRRRAAVCRSSLNWDGTSEVSETWPASDSVQRTKKQVENGNLAHLVPANSTAYLGGEQLLFGLCTFSGAEEEKCRVSALPWLAQRSAGSRNCQPDSVADFSRDSCVPEHCPDTTR